MASLEVGVLAGCKGCSSPRPHRPRPSPPYSAQTEEAECRIRVPLPLYSNEMVVGDVVQDERRRQNEKTKLFVVSWFYRAIFGKGDWPVSKLRRVEDELEVLKQSSAARIVALEGQLRAATSVAAAANSAATAANPAAAAADSAIAAADSAAATAAAALTAAHKIELLEHKLSAQETIFELKLAAAKDCTTESIRIARLEERISVASLRAELSAMRNPAIPSTRRNFSS